MQMVGAGDLGENAVGGVEVDAPAAVGDGVGMAWTMNNVLLREHKRAFEAAAFAFARNVADPFQGEVGGFGEFPGIFDVVPNSIHDAPEFPFDFLRVVDGVEAPAPFDPPEFAAAFRG